MRLAGRGGMTRPLIRRPVAALALCLLAGLGSAHAVSTTPQPRSPAEYRDHLNSLATLIEQCRQHIDASHCSADAVGPDDMVTVTEPAGTRRISYDWLRSPLELIGSQKVSPEDAVPLLHAAAQRIQLEQSEAPGSSANSTAASRVAERTALTAILDRAEFSHADPSLTQRVLEAVAIWINRRLAGLAEYSSHRRWLGLLLEWGLVALACLALAYWFLRQMRRARGLEAEKVSRAENTPAMRNWERLRQEAEQAAQQQRWRDAVRSYYWATIARFESRGQLPADQARTPREYLRLILSGHPKHDDLNLLTRRFETCWYGSDTATQLDCDAARQLFERLVAR
jgi:uncharacterized protein DUF4129